MWGFGIYLVRLADYLHARKNRKNAICDICNLKFENMVAMEAHRRSAHPYNVPREEPTN